MSIFHLPQPLMHIPCRLPDGLREQLIGHKMRAGAGCQKAAVLQQLHGTQVDFPIALHCIFHGASGFGKGGRVQNNHIKFSALCLQFGQKRKHILALKFHHILQAVQPCIFCCLVHRKLTCINPKHTFCPRNARIERK